MKNRICVKARLCSVAVLAAIAGVASGGVTSSDIAVTTIDDIAEGAVWAVPTAIPSDPQLGTDPTAYIAELAVDTDFEFYLLNGSDVEATAQAAQELVDFANAVFLAGPGVEFVVTEIVVRTSAADPYTSSDGPTTLFEAINEWSDSDIPHDVVALISGKDFNGGVLGLAGLSGLCTDTGVAVIAPSPAPGPLAGTLLTHELGHVFGAPHCTGPDCAIMCAFLGGCSGVTDAFGPGTIESILAHIESSGSCLDQPGQACNAADIAEPFGVLDLNDVQAFISAFTEGCP